MSKALTPAEAPTEMPCYLLRVVRMAVACAELWIAHAWFLGLASPAELGSMHLGTVGAFFGAAWLINRKAAGGLLVDGAMLFLTGPLAAGGMLLRRQGRSAVLAVERTIIAPVSPAESLYSNIVAGRRPRRDPSNQLSILDRLSSCDLATQQFAVAAISRTYRPEMHPALMAALQSKTPAIRVQAAAVFAKLREQYASEAKRLLEPSSYNAVDVKIFSRQNQIAAACRELARSPFLDDAVTQALKDKACHIEAEMAAAISLSEPASAVAKPVMYDKPANEMATVSERDGTVVQAHALAARRIARLFRSPSGGLERTA